MKTKTEKALREEFQKEFGSFSANVNKKPLTSKSIADWWLLKFSSLRQKGYCNNCKKELQLKDEKPNPEDEPIRLP